MKETQVQQPCPVLKQTGDASQPQNRNGENDGS